MRIVTLVALPSLLLLACGSNPELVVTPTLKVRESVEQVQVTHATPGESLALFDGSGAQVQAGTADRLGSLIFRKVTPGSGYTVRDVSEAFKSRSFTVLSVDNSLPAQTFYSGQTLTAGSGYITTRDGTPLSVYVTLPGPADMGPYPTVVTYSGYNESQPGAPLGNYASLCGQVPVLCDAPTDPSALIAGLFGYATVSVNMRGTGCSGGAYDYFETLQLLDGYDAIETVAAQSWVASGKVGMVGLSYPGITQMFVAAQTPPHLAAITPLSVIGNTATTLTPGGILNTGFAVNWVTSVLNGADPYGQGWEQARVDAGDTVCAENQLLHLQKVDNVAEATDPTFYTHEVLDPLNPTLFVDKINVPVFLVGSFQDEQTGPFFTTLLDHFTSSPLVRLTVHNGVHPDGFAPAVLAEWKNFLDLEVAQKIPVTNTLVSLIAPSLFQQIYRLPSLQLPPDRFATATSYEAARAAYEAEPQLRVIFESGGGTTPGAPVGTFEKSFASWPPAETKLQRYYLHADGSLSDAMPTEDSAASSFKLDPAAGDRGILAPMGDVWDPLPAYQWQPLTSDLAVAFVTDPLPSDLVMMGTGSADLWINSNVDDADLQMTVSEVRPDGQEMYVQGGWLRASFRTLDTTASTALWPSPTYLATDSTPLVPGEWTQVRVPIAGFGHVFRTGSRIRVSVDTPGGSRAVWRFVLKTFPGDAVHSIGHDVTHASSIALPLLDGVAAPSPLPACPSLRGQPCRAYVPFTNTAAPSERAVPRRLRL